MFCKNHGFECGEYVAIKSIAAKQSYDRTSPKVRQVTRGERIFIDSIKVVEKRVRGRILDEGCWISLKNLNTSKLFFRVKFFCFFWYPKF